MLTMAQTCSKKERESQDLVVLLLRAWEFEALSKILDDFLAITTGPVFEPPRICVITMAPSFIQTIY